MRHFLISCELYKGDEFDYGPFYDKLAAWGALPQESDTNPLWVLDIDMTLAQILRALEVHVHPDTDKVVVLECYPKSAAATQRPRDTFVQRLKSRAIAWLRSSP